MHIVEKLLEEIPEICECYKVTGEDCFVARLVARSIEQVDEIVDRVSEKAQTHTSIVKSQTIVRRAPPLSTPREQRASGARRRG